VATGILARAELGMSRQNVEHYMRFRDQMKVGADGLSNICRYGAKRLWKSKSRTWRNW